MFAGLGRKLYSKVYDLYRSRTESAVAGLEVWPRNSFVLGSLTPGVSDLDLTFWWQKRPSADEIERAFRFHRRFRRWLPLVTEINQYVQSELEMFQAFANPFELARDPRSARRMATRAPSLSEAVVFLLRLLDADAENLIRRPWVRKRKWQNHFDVVGAEFPNFQSPHELGLRTLVEAVADFASVPRDQKALAVQELEAYFSNPKRRDAESLGLPSRWQGVFLPHRFAHHWNRVLNLTSDRSDLFVSQIEWEVWGLYGQILRPDGIPGLDPYLNILVKLCRDNLSSRPEDLMRLETGLENLRLISRSNAG